MQALNRRELLRVAGFGAASLALPGAGAATRKRPNILFLFSDDQRFNTLHALNNPEIQTPHLDQLVRRGTAFTHAFIMGSTFGAVCAPSRGMLLTGQSLFHVHNNLIAEHPPAGAKRPMHTFPELLRNAGYTTFATGKWHTETGRRGQGEGVFARSFSQGENIFFGGMSDHLKVPVADFDPSGTYPKEKRKVANKFSSELFSDSAIKFLKNHKSDDPFLLYAAYTAPYDPRMAPEEYKALYPANKISLPKNFMAQHPFDNGEMRIRDEGLADWPRTPDKVRQHIAQYYAMITHVDAQIGRVMQALEHSGKAEDTIVIFAADNGLAVGQHGLMGKQNLYEHSVRVPLVVAGPGLPRHRRIDSLCYLMDMCPTICEWAGVTAPADVEGKSLLPLIRNPSLTVRDSIFTAYRHLQRGVRNERWKLILYNVKGQLTTRLFDIRKDLWELTNLATDPKYIAQIETMTTLLRDWIKKTDDPLGSCEAGLGLRV